MTFEIIQGDLFDPALQFDGLAQGVNCQGIMGAGIAVDFREKFPEMYDEYEALCGKSKHLLAGKVHSYLSKNEEDPDVYNLFTQFQPGADGNYAYLEHAAFNMRQVTEMLDSLYRILTYGDPSGYSVGMPWIGCGIAGLAKHNVEHILRSQLEDSVIRFVLVEQPTV